MININCDDDFLKKHIISIIHQKNFFLENSYSNKFFFQLKFFQDESYLFCLIDDEQIKFKLPKNFQEIFERIYDFISNKNIHLNNLKYYPFKQLMKNDIKSTFFTDIQNKIMIHLLLNQDSGVEKIELIKNIWPKDKEIFLNKLDTHLTNLKNQIYNDLNFDIKFSSKFGLLKLSIN